MKTSELMGIAYFETSPMSVCMKIGARRVIPNPVSYPDRRTVAGDGLLSQAEWKVLHFARPLFSHVECLECL